MYKKKTTPICRFLLWLILSLMQGWFHEGILKDCTKENYRKHSFVQFMTVFTIKEKLEMYLDRRLISKPVILGNLKSLISVGIKQQMFHFCIFLNCFGTFDKSRELCLEFIVIWIIQPSLDDVIKTASTPCLFFSLGL